MERSRGKINNIRQVISIPGPAQCEVAQRPDVGIGQPDRPVNARVQSLEFRQGDDAYALDRVGFDTADVGGPAGSAGCNTHRAVCDPADWVWYLIAVLIRWRPSTRKDIPGPQCPREGRLVRRHAGEG